MNIFESLENLNVSEECFNDIVGLVEEYIQEKYSVSRVKEIAASVLPKRREQNPTWRNIGRALKAHSLSEMPDSKKDMREYQDEVSSKIPALRKANNEASKAYDDQVEKGNSSLNTPVGQRHCEAFGKLTQAQDIANFGKKK